ncbi:hypothetical protein ACE1CI_14165 [Aerosakkonemataceae cyanobacterium BLCC-F50]|uniref:Chromosome partition protein Smc n=1 Tax=Floridaenema flaviceps BLCC-F50 TaxID=3153642 RepID=A0ABV4XQT3_9CYAN
MSEDRLDRIETFLERFMLVSNERMTRVEELITAESIAASNERMTRVEESIVASNERMTRVEESIAASNERMTRVEESIAASNERMTRVEESIAASNERMTRVEESIAASTERIILLERGIGDLRASISDLRDIIVGHERRVIRLEGKEVDWWGDYITLAERIQVLEDWKRQQEGNNNPSNGN